MSICVCVFVCVCVCMCVFPHSEAINIYTTKTTKNKTVINLKKYRIHCHVTLSNVLQLMLMKTCIHIKLGTCWPVIRYVYVFYCNIRVNPVWYGMAV